MANTNPYQTPASVTSLDKSEHIPNPHTLWKQLIGVVIVSIALFFFGGIFIVLTGAFTFVDAWYAGIYRVKDKKSFLNVSPMAWAIAMEFLLIVTFLLYLINRNKRKTKAGNSVFFGLVILFGILSLVVPVAFYYYATTVA